MERFNQRLENVHGCAAVEPLSLKEQEKLIRELGRYVSALEATGADRRRQIAVVGELLDDMFTHLVWGCNDNRLTQTREQVEHTLQRMTAQMPIRFTHVLLGGDAGPWASGFVSGAVTDAASVRKTAVYDEAVRSHPEMTDWPALCTVYAGRDLPTAQGTVDSSPFDLAIINQAGDSFLKKQGVHLLGGTELRIAAYDCIRVLKVEPGSAPEAIAIPNTLEAFQAAVGGYIEAVALSSGAVLVCNEEGKLIGLPANRQIGGDTIAGTFLIVGEKDGDLCSLSETDTAYYAEQFSQPPPSFASPDEPTQWEFYVF